MAQFKLSAEGRLRILEGEHAERVTHHLVNAPAMTKERTESGGLMADATAQPVSAAQGRRIDAVCESSLLPTQSDVHVASLKALLHHEKYEERNCVSVPLKTPRLFVQTPSVFPGGRTEALTNCLPWDELP